MPNRKVIQSVSNNQRLRNLKKYFRNQASNYRAIVTPGLEQISQTEIEQNLPDRELILSKGSIDFTASWKSYGRLAHSLSTVSRLYLEIGSFYARSYPELHDKVSRIPIRFFCRNGQGISISVRVNSCRLHHTRNMANCLRDAWDSQYSSSSAAGIHLLLVGNKDRFILRIDWTNKPLYRRYYRPSLGSAPIRSTVAAALISNWGLSAWKKVHDPFCGSGTLLLELARQINQASLSNDPFWEDLGFDREFPEKQLPGSKGELLGTDTSPPQLECAMANLKQAGDWGAGIRFERREFSGSEKFNEDPGLIFSNLPYGQRIQESSNLSCHDLILKLSLVYQGWTFCLILDNKDNLPSQGVHLLGLKEFYHGGVWRVAAYGKFQDGPR